MLYDDNRLGRDIQARLAALRSTVGDAKFREIEKTWVQEHQEQFDPTGLKITATYSDKSTKAIDPTDEAVTYHYDFAKPSGAAKITVTYDGQTASFTVKVTVPMPETKPATTPSSRHRRCKTATPWPCSPHR